MRLLVLTLAGALVAMPVLAQTKADPHAGHAPPAAAKAAAAPLVNAEIRRIDKANGRVTLRHEAIPNLDMGPMTMVFVATRPGMLDGFNAGDRVRFSAQTVNGQYELIRIEPAPK